MFNKTIAFLALGLVAATASANIGTAIQASAALRTAAVTQGAAHFKIYEIYMNPPGGAKDEVRGQEYIVIKGTPNTSLDGYAIVMVENEHTGGGAEDRGTVDNIIPLDGYKTDATTGLCVIRDKTGEYSPTGPVAGTTLGTITGYVAQSTSNANATFEFSDDTTSVSVGWSFNASGTFLPTTVDPLDSTIDFGGNSLENSGGNYFLVKHVNTRVDQKIEDHRTSTEIRVQTGTNLDKDLNGVLDYLQTSKPTNWVQPWETIEDAVFLPLKSNDLALSSQKDYVSSLTAGSYNTRITCKQVANSTADFFARLTNANAADDALITDVTNSVSTNRFDFDTVEDYFAVGSHTVSSYTGNTYTCPGTTGYFTVTDNSSVVWTH